MYYSATVTMPTFDRDWGLHSFLGQFLLPGRESFVLTVRPGGLFDLRIQKQTLCHSDSVYLHFNNIFSQPKCCSTKQLNLTSLIFYFDQCSYISMLSIILNWRSEFIHFRGCFRIISSIVNFLPKVLQNITQFLIFQWKREGEGEVHSIGEKISYFRKEKWT